MTAGYICSLARMLAKLLKRGGVVSFLPLVAGGYPENYM